MSKPPTNRLHFRFWFLHGEADGTFAIAALVFLAVVFGVLWLW